jgi:hypothetical protein
MSLWAVSTEGRTSNLGQIFLSKSGEGKLSAATQMQTFSLFVTAGPYSAVRQPSEMVVMKNSIRKGTKGKVFVVNNYPLVKRSEYEKRGTRWRSLLIRVSPWTCTKLGTP